jgi:N utilization substance protein B
VGIRREGREQALQTLYGIDLNPLALHDALRNFRENARIPAQVRIFAEELVTGVVKHRDELDRRIEEKSKNWSRSRMAKVDLNILRLGVFELLYRDDIPKNVTINEAIEVAKKFGTEDSPAFVNGILDEIATTVPEKTAVASDTVE